MAALLARALCAPLDLLARGCESGCAALAALRCPHCELADRFLRSRAALCVTFAVCFALAPGLAAVAYAAAFWPSAAACAASDGAGVRSLSLQAWLATHFALALCQCAAAAHVWRQFQRPFNARDPRDADCAARATWLACYDPGVALAIVAEIVQFAWLIIGARLVVPPPQPQQLQRGDYVACSGVLQAGFSAIVVVGWFFLVVGGAALAAGYVWACTCGRVEEAWAADNAEAAAAHAHAQAHAQQQAQQLAQQQQAYYGAPRAAVAAHALGGGPYQAGAVEGLAAAPPAHVAAYAPPPAVAALPVAHQVNEWPQGAPVPMAQAVAGPAAGAAPFAGVGGAPYAGGGGHVHEAPAVALARAGLGLLGGGLRAGAAAVGAVAEGVRHAAEQHRAQQAAEQNAAALAYAQQQNRRY